MGNLWVTRRLNRLNYMTSIRVYMMNPLSSSFENLIQRRGFSMESKNDLPILPVLIVGAGPVGLVLSALLTKLGVKCAVLEKGATFSTHPQAHFINNRSMEVFRKLDGLAEEIQRSQPPVDLWRKFIYCTSLTGSVIGSVDHMQPQDFDQIVSPVAVAHFSQYKLTGLLLKKLESLGFSVRTREGSGILVDRPLRERDVLMGHECNAIDAADNCISVTASFLKEGKYMEKEIKCKFLVGADGAGSAVRKLVGINMRGERDLQKLVSVHFLSRQLGQYLINEKPGMLFFIFNTAAIGVLVAHDLNQGEFVLQIPFYPPQQKLEAFTSEMCERLIFKLIGRELEDVNVLDIKPWVMHAEVAEKYLSCGNRVILAGDAAHRFPPAGGFGMNTGIQDAHNLAWKLALVVQGTAPVSIIDTYDTERRPVALSNTALSVQNFKAAMAVPTALGLDPTIANMVHEVINKAVGSILPPMLQKTVLDGIFSIGRAQLSDFVLNENNPLGSSRLAQVRHIFEEGKSLQLQFPAEDLGFRYLEGAIIPDSDSESVLDPSEPPTGRRRDYVPSADPGSRLPHMNIRVLSKRLSQETFSTLDLVSSNKVEFLLIISPVETSYRLARIILQVATEFGISVKVCVMWPNGAIDGDERTMVALAPWDNYIDVVEVRQPSNSLSWWNICKMTHRGAILVRPDEHVAWRVKSGMVSDVASVMRTVFSTVLRLESCHT